MGPVVPGRSGPPSPSLPCTASSTPSLETVWLSGLALGPGSLATLLALRRYLRMPGRNPPSLPPTPTPLERCRSSLPTSTSAPGKTGVLAQIRHRPAWQPPDPGGTASTFNPLGKTRFSLTGVNGANFLFSQVPGSPFLLLRATFPIFLVTFGPALGRSVPRRLPQSSLHLSPNGTSGVLLPHRRTANGSPLPRPPPLPDHFRPDPTFVRHPATRLRPQTSRHRQGGQTRTALDMFPLLAPPASLAPEIGDGLDCSRR